MSDSEDNHRVEIFRKEIDKGNLLGLLLKLSAEIQGSSLVLSLPRLWLPAPSCG